MTGRAMRGNKIAHGDYGLVALEPAWITNRQIDRYGFRFSLTNRLPLNRLKPVWVVVKAPRNTG